MDAIAARLALEMKSYSDWTAVSQIKRVGTFQKHLRVIGRNWEKPSHRQQMSTFKNPFTPQEWESVDLPTYILRLMWDRGFIDWRPSVRNGLGSVKWVSC
ncbi:hypothetical protein VCRA2127O344_50088 [Vibrio crassostreae]|nr:hypothetical protein VCRA2127O344_50088 [Vibrio crassostreae]